ncbi:hypothetical protein RSAG8_06923, partial [Rhizoctonia solani AG-8 WAC10335]
MEPQRLLEQEQPPYREFLTPRHGAGRPYVNSPTFGFLPANPHL